MTKKKNEKTYTKLAMYQFATLANLVQLTSR